MNFKFSGSLYRVIIPSPLQWSLTVAFFHNLYSLVIVFIAGHCMHLLWLICILIGWTFGSSIWDYYE